MTTKRNGSTWAWIIGGLGLSLVLADAASAAKKCTSEPRARWMGVDEFKRQKQAEGYTIRKFKQPGTCYEIYGKDRDGNDVEIYFNPVDGSIVQSAGR